jgi:hypothetical protein
MDLIKYIEGSFQWFIKVILNLIQDLLSVNRHIKQIPNQVSNYETAL